MDQALGRTGEERHLRAHAELVRGEVVRLDDWLARKRGDTLAEGTLSPTTSVTTSRPTKGLVSPLQVHEQSLVRALRYQRGLFRDPRMHGADAQIPRHRER